VSNRPATPQPTPTVDIFLANYLAEIVPLLTDLTQEMDDFGKILLRAESPEVMYSEEWLAAVVVAMVQIKATLKDIRDVAAPPVANECHNLLHRATIHYDMAIEAMATSIDTMDSNLSRKSTEEMKNADQLMQEFNACIKRKLP
jgi:hypothetical protein